MQMKWGNATNMFKNNDWYIALTFPLKGNQWLKKVRYNLKLGNLMLIVEFIIIYNIREN